MKEKQNQKKFYETWQFFVLVLVIIIGFYVTVNLSGTFSSKDRLKNEPAKNEDYINRTADSMSLINEHVANYIQKVTEFAKNPNVKYDSEWQMGMDLTVKAIEDNINNLDKLNPPKKYTAFNEKLKEMSSFYKIIPKKTQSALDEKDIFLLNQITEGIQKGLNANDEAHEILVEMDKENRN